MRPTRAVIDLSAIKKNIERIKLRVENIDPVRKGRVNSIPNRVKILACVKANAYGHGIVEVAEAIQDKIDYFGVASVEEGRVLRSRGIRNPILILGSILPQEAKELIEYNLSQSLCSMEVADALNRYALKKDRKVKVHIKVDTGMGRIGIKPDGVVDFIGKVRGLKNLDIEGIFTHFPTSDEADKSFTYEQIKIFKRVIQDVEKIGTYIPLRHTANSAAILDIPESFFNMVRAGLAIYGYYPSPHVRRTVELEPALSLLTKIVFLKELAPGASVSYGRTYITDTVCKIATLPIGYGDGYSRSFSNKGEVLVRGKRVPVVGRVCMDQTIVDVSRVEGVEVGDEVALIGRQKDEQITVEEVAQKIGTIPHEVVSMIGKRVPRIYTET
ncbi:MAG TPA: alanine racemase [Candidatus Omnitrophica bacterium]|nr:alanine racemase [Candidatus Omnitrophota bacterium]